MCACVATYVACVFSDRSRPASVGPQPGQTLCLARAIRSSSGTRHRRARRQIAEKCAPLAQTACATRREGERFVQLVPGRRRVAKAHRSSSSIEEFQQLAAAARATTAARLDTTQAGLYSRARRSRSVAVLFGV